VVSAYESAMARGDSNNSAKARPTDSKGRFLKWEIVEPRSGEPHILSTLGPVTVKFTVEMNACLEKAVHGIALFNHDRQLMWGWAAYDFEVPRGVQEFRYVFPMLPLRPGPYSWLVSLYQDDDEIDVWECIPEMIVATESLQHKYDQWSGILNIPSKFSVTPEAKILAGKSKRLDAREEDREF